MSLPASSENMKSYFTHLLEEVKKTYAQANTARAQGFDPEDHVEVVLAENLAERVIGLISIAAPQIREGGVAERILELEDEYGKLDWRVALTIALEVAKEKYCTFSSQVEAIETGIRVGFAYVTNGVVSAPLEGFTKLEIKSRKDGGQYFSLFFSGPIRNAGGTAAAVSVLIADYIRVNLGFMEYDPTEKEIRRCAVELEDYHNYITNLQYFPSSEETTYLMQHLPVEIDGEESEKYEVSNINVKDLPRVKANRLRNGYCLIHSSCIPLKAPKLWVKLEKWGEAFNLGHWSFLKDFIKLQKRMKAREKEDQEMKIRPDYTYIQDLVAGRPVFAHPLRPGGWRLRYGRSRASGYSSQAIHPASMAVLNGYLATGTQLKTERPGKAAAFTPCDTINGPIVKLKDGSVLQVKTEEEATKVANQIDKILYLGDVLVNYGDFFDRAHPLVPAGYCPEFWVEEFEKAAISKHSLLDIDRLAATTQVRKETIKLLLNNPLRTEPSIRDALQLSDTLGVPLHPSHTLFWSLISAEQISILLKSISQSEKEGDQVIFSGEEVKETLEILGVDHKQNEGGALLSPDAYAQITIPLGLWLNNDTPVHQRILERIGKGGSTMQIINNLSPIKIRDKAGTFIGSRMGRPEKAKMRKMTGSPHVLFPVGEEGGRLRSFQAALEKGHVTAAFPICRCEKCDITTPLFRCESCGEQTERLRSCTTCGTVKECPHKHEPSSVRSIDIKRIFEGCLAKMGTHIYPDLIKGVRGTSNNEHIPEHLLKGILRAKYKIAVNKDGTVRYDASELTLTHFKPQEIGTSVERLKKMGYHTDIHGEPLNVESQTLELKAQDVVLPCSPENPEDPADEVFFRVAGFVDELLVKLYGSTPYFKLKSKEDLVGHLIVGLAPHTSAGTLGRIIGCSKTQGFLAHPYFHAAMRRDCDGDEACFVLLMDALLNFSRKYLPESRGSTMDAPLVLTSILIPSEVDDMAFHVDIAWKYPLDFYLASLEYKKPWEVSVPQIKELLDSPAQFEGMGFTHDTTDINAGVRCSAYKLLPSMEEKLKGQMDLAVKIKACDESDVARLVIEKHFIRDTKGNLRKFSQQQYRCVRCNTKYRRPPLRGNCSSCGGKIIFTISEGSVVKYLEPSISLAEKFNVPTYLKQDLELTKRRIESVFGRDAETQQGLGQWFAKESPEQ